MTNPFTSSWFFWAVAVGVGLPALLIGLTEWRDFLIRRHHWMARQIGLIRNYLVPLGALVLLLVETSQIPDYDFPVRLLTTLFWLMVLILLLSGLNATMFEGAPAHSWRKKLPGIFLDVARFVIIGAGLLLILSLIWGVRVGGLFTALGVTSVVIGLMLQNSVGQVVSGLFMLFEQPFRINDWLDTGTVQGRVVEVNWRAVHIDTGSGLRIMPNSLLASSALTNLSRPVGSRKLDISTSFSPTDAPDVVCATLNRVARGLPQLKAGTEPCSVSCGSGNFRTTVELNSPSDDGGAQGTFLRWAWYAARRAELHLDGIADDFSTAQRLELALRDVVAPALQLSVEDERMLFSSARLVRFGAGEVVEYADEMPVVMTFLVSGHVQLIAPISEGPPVVVTTLGPGAFLGLTALIRHPNLATGLAREEVIALVVAREDIEQLVARKPMLVKNFGAVLEERRARVHQASGSGHAG